MKWWSNELSKNEYDGVIGLSQGSAMTDLLLSSSMVSTTFPFFRFPAIRLLFGKQIRSLESNSIYAQLNHLEKVPAGFHPQKTQPIKFAILCSGKYEFMQQSNLEHLRVLTYPYPHALQASYLTASHMRIYMECQKIYQLYTVSQIVTNSLDYFSDHFYILCWCLSC